MSDTSLDTGLVTATPPIAKRVPFERVHHGDVYVDHYEWLRDKESPDTLAYLEAENAWTELSQAHLAGLRDQLYGELMTKEAEKSAEVTGDEIKKYYDEHRDDPALRQPERIAAAHILVAARPTQIAAQLQQERNLAGASLDAAVREELARRRQRAEELRRRAAAGEDFAKLARENSDDDATKQRGGDLGTFARDAHARAFDEAAFALTKPGEVSPVVQTDFGFHVIKLTRREPARTLTLDEAAPDIRKRLAEEKRAQTLRGWLEEARKRAQVRVAEAFRFGELKDKYPAM
jgi:parvulin-like peptidyl-prolyl isomerase